MDAYCLLDVYQFLRSRYPTDDHLRSFRGKKPKKLDSTIARQIDANFAETNPNPAQSTDDTHVGLEEKDAREFISFDIQGLTGASSAFSNKIRCG